MTDKTYPIRDWWLMQHRNKRDQWSKMQLELLGVSWPPKPGWFDRLLGQKIETARAIQFEKLGKQFSSRTWGSHRL